MAIERRRTSASSGVRSGTRTPNRTDVRRTLPVGPGPADGHLPYHPPLRGRVGACVLTPKLPALTAFSPPSLCVPPGWAGWAGRLWRRPAARLVRGPGWRLAAVLVGAFCPPLFMLLRARLPLSPLCDVARHRGRLFQDIGD